MIISGILVHAQPGQMKDVENLLTNLPGVDIHETTPQGQMVVVVEEDDKNTGAILKDVHFMDGVLSAALVYQESLPDGAHEGDIS
jgi:periplasmic nitrate reductase NapD